MTVGVCDKFNIPGEKSMICFVSDHLFSIAHGTLAELAVKRIAANQLNSAAARTGATDLRLTKKDRELFLQEY